MIISNVNIGSGPGANDGESIYSAFYKVNQNFANVQSNVNSLTNSVSSVAGRTGNVTLTINDIVGLNTSYAINGNVTAANIGMKGYVDAKIAANITALIDSAPGALDTLNELAAALNDDASFATTIVNTVTLANTIQSNQITAANLGMKGYVDSVASQSIYGNSNVGSYLTTYTGNIKAGFANITGSVLGLNALTVGLPGIEIFGNTVAQFHSNIDQSLNVAVHNLSPGSQATSGFMASADVGDEDNHHTLMGIVNSGWDITHPFLKPLDSLLLGIGGNLVLGTRSVSGPSIPKDIAFVVGDGSTLEVLRINAQSDLLQANLVLGANVGIKFNDGSRQTSAYSNVQTAAYTNLSTYAYNANVTAANLGMKGYVDSVASQSIYGNANVASYLHANNYSPYSNVNVAVFTNLSTYAYNANVTAANVGMKGYVDNAVATSGYSNVQVATYLPTYSGNIGNISFSDADDVGGLTHTIKGVMSYVMLNAPDNTRLVGVTGNVEIWATGPQWRFDTFGNITLPSNIAAINYANGVSILSGLGGSNYSNVQVATYLPTYSGNLTAGNVTITGNVRLPNQYNNYLIVGGGTPGFSVDSIPSYWISGGISTYGLKVNVADFERANIAGNLYVNGFITFNDQTTQTSAYSNIQVATYLPTYSGNVTTLNITANTALIDYSNGVLNVEGGTSIKGNLVLFQSLHVSGNIDLDGNRILGGTNTQFTIGGNVQAGNVSVPGISGKIGFSSGGFVQQATSNTTQVTSNTTSGNIQLMSIDIGAHAVHTVTFACNKLTTNDLLLVKHISGGLTSVYVDAYVASAGLAVIWLRDITGSGTGAFTPMLKYAIIRAPSS